MERPYAFTFAFTLRSELREYDACPHEHNEGFTDEERCDGVLDHTNTCSTCGWNNEHDGELDHAWCETCEDRREV